MISNISNRGERLWEGNVKFSALDVSDRKSSMQAGDMVIVDTIRPQVDMGAVGK